MPFSSTASLTSTDMNNTLRGLYRDNADHALTGTVAETDLASTSITANTIGATGCLYFVAWGTITNSGGGAKTIRFKFGSTTVGSVSRTAANAQDWMFEAFVTNTATNAQRVLLKFSTADAVTLSAAVGTMSEDSTANITVKITGQLANTADTITQKAYNIFVAQIT